MYTFTKWCFGIALMLIGSFSMAQGTITGTVLDEDGTELPGVNVMVDGTQMGAVTDFDGKFSISGVSQGTLVLSYLGYAVIEREFMVGNGQTENLGTFTMEVDANQMGEVLITGTIDIAKDRETPVAVSTVRATEIQEKLGSQEFVEILNTTPSIYATKQGGGYGDSRINIRGFDTQNSAVMINGIPVNDMENGRVFWSNWAGLSDVASAIQVQRGLGSSKLAISSVGGTINVLTRSAEAREGGFVSTSVGNNNFLKTVASFNTGKLDNGLSMTGLLSRTAGDGYVDGTEFEGYNYYFGLGYEISDSQNIQFFVTGAPQIHNRRGFAPGLRDYIRYGADGEPRIKYNSDWGTYRGAEYSFAGNYYHKPLMAINYDWDINDKLSLSANVYSSFGRGGSAGGIGRGASGDQSFAGVWKNPNGTINVDRIVAWNTGSPVDDFGTIRQRTMIDGQFLNSGNQDRSSANGISRRNSVNSHNWYGAIANLNYEVNDALTLDFGVDLRKYKGFHYRRLNDLLGADGYRAEDDLNNPGRVLTTTYDYEIPWWVFSSIDDEEKIDYYDIGYVNWVGAFGQAEYSVDNLSVFVQGAISNQGFSREELFRATPPEKTDTENLLGGNIKGGVNYNINDNHNVYANAGYYSKQPLFDAVFLNNSNTLNTDLQNETIIGTELGYGFRSGNLRANVNLYRTSWSDRFENIGATIDTAGDGLGDDNTDGDETDDIRGSANVSGITQVHMGLEIDATYRITNRLRANAMLSVGNWECDDDVTATFLDDSQNVIQFTDGSEANRVLPLDGLKVGDAAQLTWSLGASYDALDWLTLDSTYRFADELYADFDPTNVDGDGAYQLPSFGLLDAGLSLRHKMTDGKSVVFRFNMNNVLDEIYISESETNIRANDGDETYNGINTRNRVFFGLGRTWNASIRYNF